MEQQGSRLPAIVTPADLEKALGLWMFVVRHHDGQSGKIELRLRRPWHILGRRFHLWVAQKVSAIVAWRLPIGVSLCVWRNYKKDKKTVSQE